MKEQESFFLNKTWTMLNFEDWKIHLRKNVPAGFFHLEQKLPTLLLRRDRNKLVANIRRNRESLFARNGEFIKIYQVLKGRVRRWKLPANWRPRSEHKSNCSNVKILKRNERMSVQSVGRVSPWIGWPLACSWRCLNLSLFCGISLLSSNIEIMLFYVSLYSHLSHFFFRILNNNMARS